MSAKLWGCSDLHVGHTENRLVVERIWPRQPEDWLIIAGDVAESIADIRWALRLLQQRFAKMIWAPGNHEMWSTAIDPLYLRGVRRYRYLVDMCRDLGVVTPEDTYPLLVGGRRTCCPGSYVPSL
jgi:3',5'-cyclic AMP phosphodiesterase CpdA